MEAMPTTQLQQELRFFDEHRRDLLSKVAGMYVLIKADELAGAFESENEAVAAGYRRFGNEPFLVKHVVEADVALPFATFNLGA